MRKVIVFAGTIEGRTLSEYLAGEQVAVTACVATEYGGTLLKEQPGLTVHTGRMDQEQMTAFLREQDPLFVVDATHPYAVVVSENVKKACDEADVEYIRLVRDTGLSGGSAGQEEMIEVTSVEEAVDYLKTTEGNILATTGSKELSKYTELPDYANRVFARVLSTGEVAAACEKLGFVGRNLICMQGPFSEAMNAAMLQQFDCKYLVTKETGKAGGFEEKLRAAKRAGAKVVLVGRPPEQEGYSYEEIQRMMRVRLELPQDPEEAGKKPEEPENPSTLPPRCVTLIGIGMGTPSGLTVEATKAIKEADLLIGADRMLEAVDTTGKAVFSAYLPVKIADYIAIHSDYKKVAILLSGDIGFYSGAKKLYEALEGGGYEIRSSCGISSVVYFCGKLKTAWEDVCLKSTHGRNANLIGAVRTHAKTFTLLSAKDSVKELCGQLQEYGLSDVKVNIGERLGYPEERITSGTPAELEPGTYDGLVVALIENENASSATLSCIDDDAFIRGKAPMTKSEIRSLSVAKLQLPKDAVVYDVGAGTGSVTIEMALQAVDGMVYAIERNEEACVLIEENKRKFGTPNIEVICGLAPTAMENLPIPTHAFIGGSAGNLKEILQCLLAMNPKIRLVINTVTLETIGEVMDCLKEFPELIEEETISVSVARSKSLGKYHLMMGQNPIYIITCRGGQPV
jgi:precorrin-6Y C5,15-methyltransferase (decarboxylating)